MAEQVNDKKAGLSMWRVLLRKWFIILIAMVLCLGGATAYSILKIKPIYTAKTSIVLKMAVTQDMGTNTSNTNINNATLVKKNLPTVKECILSAKMTTACNEYYNEINGTTGNNISKGAISVSYGESSMIFSLSYTDVSEELASKKLSAIVNVSPEILGAEIKAESLDLVPVQNFYDVSVSDGTAKVISIGGVIGIVLGVGVALLIYLLDNKISTKEELEEVVGTDILGYIEKGKK